MAVTAEDAWMHWRHVVLCSASSLPAKGFRMRQAQRGGNGNREITGIENAVPSTLYLQVVLPWVKHSL